MSRINTPANLSPVQATPRGRLTPRRKTAVMAAQGLLCAREGCFEVWAEVDHIKPLALGGADEDWNCEGLCRAHHRKKTDADLERIAKAKAQAGETGQRNPNRKKRRSIPKREKAWPPKGARKLPSRPFGA